jgi:SNF2 family DNA or RNA helicase
MLIVDESHRVKRFRGGEWAPALVGLAEHATVRMILTGTPMPQAPTDLWSQFNILWPGEEATGTRGAFEASTKANFKTTIGRLEPFFTRTPKSELGLTEPRFCEPEVPMAPLQADVYQLIVEQLRGRIPDSANWQEKIERLRRARPIRLIQVASNPDLLNESDGFFDIPAIEDPGATLMQRLESYRQHDELPAKFEWALGYLGGLKDAGEKCVVWTTFIRNIDQFEALVANRLGGPVFTVDGRVPAAETADPEINAAREDDDHSGEEIDETREKRIDDFLGAEGFAVLIANPAACAESISLHQGCFRAVFLDRTHDCARWLQSIDRIHRLGLPEGITVEVHAPKATLAGAAAIDQLVATALVQKEARMKELLNDAELRGSGLEGQDTLQTAEGSNADLNEILRYLLGGAQVSS